MHACIFTEVDSSKYLSHFTCMKFLSIDRYRLNSNTFVDYAWKLNGNNAQIYETSKQ